MNVADKWMLEQMQQMAASMANPMPQASQNAEAPKTEKGESFQDMMDKAKAGETPKHESAPAEKTEDAQPQEPTQTQKTEKVPATKNEDGSKTVQLTAEQAAMVAAGYAQLFFKEDGSAMTVVCIDEEGNLVRPLALEDNAHFYSGGKDALQAGGDWVIDPTPEFVEALEQLLRKTGDPRSVDDILAQVERKLQDPQAQNKVEIKAFEAPEEPEVEAPVERLVKPDNIDRAEVKTNQDDRDDTDSGLEAEVMAAPLFQDVKAAPVKVGENFQLDTERPEMDSKLADTIRMAAQGGLREVEIKLSPENLGTLTIKLTQSADGALQVVLHTANAKAANLLNQHLDGLNQALQGYGQSQEVRVEVQRSEDSQQAGQQQQQQTDPDGRGQHSQQQQEQRRQDNGHSGDFIQKLRLGLFGADN